MYKNEGLTKEIRHAFVIYLASAPRPIHELLEPNLINQQKIFEQEFIGMADTIFEYHEFEETRLRLIRDLQQQLTDRERQFLISIKQGKPKYELMEFKNIDKLPALQWKISNIEKMDVSKKKLMLAKLEKVLFG